MSRKPGSPLPAPATRSVSRSPRTCRSTAQRGAEPTGHAVPKLIRVYILSVYFEVLEYIISFPSMLLSMSSYEKPQRECQFIKLTTCTVKLFSDMPTNTKSNKRFRLYISEGKKITKISSTALKQVTQRDCGTSIPACSEDPAGQGHG